MDLFKQLQAIQTKPVEKPKYNPAYPDMILKHFFKRPDFTTGDVVKELKIPVEHAQTALQRLWRKCLIDRRVKNADFAYTVAATSVSDRGPSDADQQPETPPGE